MEFSLSTLTAHYDHLSLLFEEVFHPFFNPRATPPSTSSKCTFNPSIFLKANRQFLTLNLRLPTKTELNH